MMRNLVIAASCAGALVLGGCSKTLSPEEQLAKHVEAGWILFGAADYTGAEAEFRSATETVPSDAGAQLGLGWSLLPQDRLSSAKTAFLRVTGRETPEYRYAQAGLAFLYDAQGYFDLSVSAAEFVLGRDDAFALPYDEEIDWRDLSFLLAKNYLILSTQSDPNLTSARGYLARIDAAPALDPNDSATWTAQGLTYRTLAEALLKRLEGVRTGIGG